MKACKKKLVLFSVSVCYNIFYFCLYSAVEILKGWTIDFFAFPFFIYCHKLKTSGSISGIQFGPVA